MKRYGAYLCAFVAFGLVFGRFTDLAAVIAHYERLLRLPLTEQEGSDLVQCLKLL